MRNLSLEEIKEIPVMIENGMRMTAIAAHFGCSRRTIQNWIEKYRKAGKELPILRGRPPMPI